MTPRLAGALCAIVIFVADQAHKLWMLHVFDIRSRQPVHVTSFFDLVLVWNPGISYSLLRAETPLGRWLLFGFVVLATGLLSWWMWRAQSRVLGLGLGLIVGGALGNGLDRLLYGAVADFFHFYLDTEGGRWSWYVFNIADVAIVVGAALLLWDTLFGPGDGQPQAAAQENGGQEKSGQENGAQEDADRQQGTENSGKSGG